MTAEECTLLLVDDEAANLDLLELMLRPRGFARLVRVSDAREAVATFEAVRPDLVLLDLHMPHRTGFELLDDLRARVPAEEFLPVLVLTADATPAARARALAGGAHDFVTKPFDRTEVLLRVRNLLRTRVLYLEQRRALARAERVAARERLLAEASRLLATTADGATALAPLARLLADGLRATCAIELVVAHGLARVAHAAADDVDRAGVHDGSDTAGVATLRVPIASGVETIGWLALAPGAGAEPFDDDDRRVAAEVARRAALALENARLLRATQDAVAARDQVLAIVAHDLRSPLTAVRFDVEMLRLEPAQPIGDADARVLERVERAAGRMDALIQDLLDVSRLNRHALGLERRPQDMRALLEEAVATLRPIVAAQGARFVAHGPDALPTLAVDGPRLLQALSNLVGNAAKFAATDGCVELAWAVDGAELRIHVRDDGPGIAPEALPHVFGAFWQARHADRRGLGLGLAIALGIVEAHGGRLWVESQLGAGSTFVLALPIAASDAASNPRATSLVA